MRSKISRPSPAMVVALMALVGVVAGTAIAGPIASNSALSKKDKKQVKSIAANQVNTLAPGLSVANAGAVDNIDSAGLVQVKTRVRTATDTTEDANYGNDVNLLQLSNLAGGQYVITATTQLDNDDGADLSINCDLVAVATELDSQTEIHGLQGGPAEVLSHILIGQFTASAAGTDDVFVRCTSSGTTDADQEKIIATLVNN